MLTGDVLEAAKAAGKLVPARAIVPWAAEPRAFLMCKPLCDAIETARLSPDPLVIKRWAQLEADISHFIEEGYITEDRMKQLEPYEYEHWELRSLRPRSSLRVFGRSAAPDVFIGTHVVERPPLGEKWSVRWEIEKLNCEEYWNDAGLGMPFSGSAYEDYITENASRRVRVQR
jgi:hypothetical protein